KSAFCHRRERSGHPRQNLLCPSPLKGHHSRSWTVKSQSPFHPRSHEQIAQARRVPSAHVQRDSRHLHRRLPPQRALPARRSQSRTLPQSAHRRAHRSDSRGNGPGKTESLVERSPKNPCRGSPLPAAMVQRRCLCPPTFSRPLRSFLPRKSTRLNSSHVAISYAVFCLKKKNI